MNPPSSNYILLSLQMCRDSPMFISYFGGSYVLLLFFIFIFCTAVIILLTSLLSFLEKQSYDSLKQWQNGCSGFTQREIWINCVFGFLVAIYSNWSSLLNALKTKQGTFKNFHELFECGEDKLWVGWKDIKLTFVKLYEFFCTFPSTQQKYLNETNTFGSTFGKFAITNLKMFLKTQFINLF